MLIAWQNLCVFCRGKNKNCGSNTRAVAYIIDSISVSRGWSLLVLSGRKFSVAYYTFPSLLSSYKMLKIVLTA